MYAVILTVHSVVRWVVLGALILRVSRALLAIASSGGWSRADRILSGVALGCTHLQVVLGLALYAVSPKVAQSLSDMGAAMADPTLRFWVVEHPTSMVLAAIAVQVGFSLAKRAPTDAGRHSRSAVGFGLGLLLILAGIPWAFRGSL